MKMQNGAEKKRQAIDSRIRNAPLENIPETTWLGTRTYQELDVALHLDFAESKIA